MTSKWPPLDTHAHLDTDIGARDLLGLRALVFAVTRSISEAHSALSRTPHDEMAIWGVGTHPASAEALNRFEPGEFTALLERGAFVGEIGMDGTVKSRQTQQQEVFDEVLTVLQHTPRLTSIHSYRATDKVLASLQARPIRGVILHWWLGDRPATAAALELGAYFSANFANADHLASLNVPLDRVLFETDHPDGDRRSPAPRRPGRIEPVEQRLAASYGVTPDELRLTSWRNLRRLAQETDSLSMLPPRVRSLFDAIPTT